MSIPKRYYRYGIAAEKDLFDQVKAEDCVDGFVMPAQLIVDQKSSLAPWLMDKRFFIDPMTHVWFSDRCDLGGSNGNEFKRSYEKLRQKYGAPFSELSQPTDKIDASSVLASDSKFKNLLTGAERILEFQDTFVQERVDEEIEAYNEILKEKGYGTEFPSKMKDRRTTKSDRLVLPYVHFETTQTKEYELNKRIWSKFEGENAYQIPMCVVVATSQPGPDWDTIVNDLNGRFSQAILWFSEIDELSSTADQLLQVRRACKSLSDRKFTLHMHSGGAFAMGLGFDGLDSVAGGATYGERRRLALVEGGPVPQRYFVPQLLRVLPLAEARFAVETLGLDCHNACCSDLDSDADAFVAKFFPGKKETSWGPTWYTKMHYVLRFKEKMREIWKDGKDTGIARLTDMKGTAEAAGLHEDYWSHLSSWIEAYSGSLE